jgi:hypothetical protein
MIANTGHRKGLLAAVWRTPGRGVRASFAADGADEANPSAFAGLWRGKGEAM